MGNLKKITYFLDFPFIVGGSNIVLLTQAHIMKQKGYKVEVVIPNDENGNHSNEYDRICGEYGLQSISACYAVATCLEEIDIIRALDEYKDIVNILKNNDTDLVHSVQLNIAVELAARELKIPHLMNIYQVDRQAFHVHWLEVYPRYHSADAVMMSDRWGNGLGIASRCIRGAYAVGKESRIRECNTGTEIRILSMGVMSPHKNQLECLKFVSKCRENGYLVKLAVFGYDKTPYADLCRKYVEEEELQDCVQFMGFVSNVYDYFENADLLMVASTVESYPSVIIASMANGVPVISTPVGGVPELLKDRQNGFLAGGYTGEELYEAFLRYLEDRKSGRLRRLTENAYNTYLKRHTYKVAGNALEEYYQWIMDDYVNKVLPSLSAFQIRQRMSAFWYERNIDVSLIKSNKVWLLYHIISETEQKDNKKVMIWGVGYWGKITYEWICALGDQIEFVGFIDTFKQGTYMDYPIISGNDLEPDTCGTIMITVQDAAGRLEIMNLLDRYGKERNRDYFLVWNGPVRI